MSIMLNKSRGFGRCFVGFIKRKTVMYCTKKLTTLLFVEIWVESIKFPIVRLTIIGLVHSLPIVQSGFGIQVIVGYIESNNDPKAD